MFVLADSVAAHGALAGFACDVIFGDDIPGTGVDAIFATDASLLVDDHRSFFIFCDRFNGTDGGAGRKVTMHAAVAGPEGGESFEYRRLDLGVGLGREVEVAVGVGVNVGVGVADGVAVGVAVAVGVDVAVGVAVGVAVAVAVAVAVGVGLCAGVAVAVGVGVGVRPDCAQYLPPVLNQFAVAAPPQTIISLPLQMAV